MGVTDLKPEPRITICPKHGIVMADKDGRCKACVVIFQQLRKEVIDVL